MLKLRDRIKNEKGFTLVELMVVIAIIGILATIGFMKMQDATASANGAKIIADLRTIDNAIIMAQANGQSVTATGTGATIGSPVSDYLDTVPTPPNSGYYLTRSMTSKAQVSGTAYAINADTAGNLHATYGGQTATQLTTPPSTSH